MHNALNEIPIFLSCLRTGLLTGVLYEILSLFRLSGKRVLCAVIDVVFGLAATAAAALTLLYCDYGRIRLYELVAMILGAFIIHRYPGKLIRSAFAAIKNKIHR